MKQEQGNTSSALYVIGAPHRGCLVSICIRSTLSAALSTRHSFNSVATMYRAFALYPCYNKFHSKKPTITPNTSHQPSNQFPIVAVPKSIHTGIPPNIFSTVYSCACCSVKTACTLVFLASGTQPGPYDPYSPNTVTPGTTRGSLSDHATKPCGRTMSLMYVFL